MPACLNSIPSSSMATPYASATSSNVCATMTAPWPYASAFIIAISFVPGFVSAFAFTTFSCIASRSISAFTL